MFPDEVLVLVQREWNGWHKAFVPLRDLQNIHWFQPSGAPKSLVHAYVRRTSIVEGDLDDDCEASSEPRLLVCILKCHNTVPVYEEIVHRADPRNALARLKTANVWTPERALDTVLTELAGSRPLRLLLDYDGTLVPIARSPELAAPDEELLSILDGLARVAPQVRTEIVSGRSRDTLEGWLGALPLPLWAEHGFWYRPSLAAPWQPAAPVPTESLGAVQAILEQFAAATPGAQVEVKRASLAWHYRRADCEFGARQAHELRMLLGDALGNQPFEVVDGKKVIEIRLRGVSKALVARRVLADHDPEAVFVAIGDDRTDEDLFRALPPSSITVAVGNRPAGAGFRVDDYRAVRRLLRSVGAAALRTPTRQPASECL